MQASSTKFSKKKKCPIQLCLISHVAPQIEGCIWTKFEVTGQRSCWYAFWLVHQYQCQWAQTDGTILTHFWQSFFKRLWIYLLLPIFGYLFFFCKKNDPNLRGDKVLRLQCKEGPCPCFYASIIIIIHTSRGILLSIQLPSCPCFHFYLNKIHCSSRVPFSSILNHWNKVYEVIIVGKVPPTKTTSHYSYSKPVCQFNLFLAFTLVIIAQCARSWVSP